MNAVTDSHCKPDVIPLRIEDGKLLCKKCGQPMRVMRYRDEFPDCDEDIADRIQEAQTLLGYNSPEGHNHDDNCWTREYLCPSGHHMKIGKVRKCHCGWRGKESCNCHDGMKVDEFPEG